MALIHGHSSGPERSPRQNKQRPNGEGDNYLPARSCFSYFPLMVRNYDKDHVKIFREVLNGVRPLQPGVRLSNVSRIATPLAGDPDYLTAWVTGHLKSSCKYGERGDFKKAIRVACDLPPEYNESDPDELANIIICSAIPNTQGWQDGPF